MTPQNEAANSPAEAIPVAAIPLLSLAAFAVALSTRVTDPLLPQLAKEFGVSLGDASGAITFFAIAYGISQLLFGPLGDRYGKCLVIACTCCASAVTSILCGLASSFPMLLAARLAGGMTAAAMIPLSMAWIGDVVPYQLRQPILARFLIGQILGVSAGAFVGGLAADRLGWRTPFFAVALLFLATGIALLLLNRRLPQHARAVRRAEGPVVRRMVAEFSQVLSSPWARMVLLSVFLEGAFLFGALAFIASHIFRSFGISLTVAGSLVMLFGFGGLLFALASGRLVRRLGEPGLSIGGGMLAAASLLAIALAPVWWWAIPACLVSGLGFYMLHNTLQINATQMAPERRGAAVSAFACSYFIGQATGVGAAGLLVEGAGTAAVLAAGGAGVLLVALNFHRGLRMRALAGGDKPV